MSEDILTLPPPTADARIQYGDGPYQYGDLRLPDADEPYPLVITIHGGYWRSRYDLAYLGHVCAALRRLGIATWNIEYRRIGHPGGGWPGTFADVALAADFVRELATQYPIDRGRVLALGHSAGGHLACWLALRRNIPSESELHGDEPLAPRRVVSLAGVLDLRRAWEQRLSANATQELLRATPEDDPARYNVTSPIELLPAGIPQTLIHGSDDENVPIEQSRRYAEAARDRGDTVNLIELAATGHFEIVDPRAKQWRVVEAATVDLLA
jgi:acetyl esterase/lipase